MVHPIFLIGQMGPRTMPLHCKLALCLAMALVRLAPPEGPVTIRVDIPHSSSRPMYWPRRVLVSQQVKAAPCHLLARSSIRSMPSQVVELPATSPSATIFVEQPLTISGVMYNMARQIFPGSSVPRAVAFDQTHALRMHS